MAGAIITFTGTNDGTTFPINIDGAVTNTTGGYDIRVPLTELTRAVGGTVTAHYAGAAAIAPLAATESRQVAISIS